jgi:hypothetical protein
VLSLRLSAVAQEPIWSRAAAARMRTDLSASRDRVSESWAIGWFGKDAVTVVSSGNLLTHMHTRTAGVTRKAVATLLTCWPASALTTAWRQRRTRPTSVEHHHSTR